jgi:hypothetical protein
LAENRVTNRRDVCRRDIAVAFPPKNNSTRFKLSAEWDHILGEFADGTTASVSGNDNRHRLARALATLHDIEHELTGKK